MRSTPCAPLLCALLLLAVIPSLAFATPSASLRWDTCDDGSSGLPSDKEFAGPGTYTQVVSGRGFTSVARGVSIELELRAPGGLPDAWRFDATGCQAGAVSFSIAGVSKACVSLGSGSIVLSSFTYDPVRGAAHVRLSATLDGTTTPNPSTAYVLAKIGYDHSASVAGVGGSGQCGGADAPVCFQLLSASYLDSDGTEHALTLSNALLTWQNPTQAIPCYVSPFTGVRVSEFLPQCGVQDTTEQFIELGSFAEVDAFDSHLRLRIKGTDDAVRFDAGDLFGAAREGQPWPMGQTWLLATRGCEVVNGISADLRIPAVLDPTGGRIELYDARDPGAVLQSVGYGPGTPNPVPPSGSSLARGTDTDYFATPPSPTNSLGQTPVAFLCPIGDEQIMVRQLAFACASGFKDGQFLELRAPVDQRFESGMRLVVRNSSGTPVFDQHNLFPGESDGTVWPAGRSWLLGGPGLYYESGAAANFNFPAILDPVGGSIDLYGGGGAANLLVAHLAYGPGQPTPAAPNGYGLRLQDDGSYALDPVPAPTNFAGVTGANSACYCPGPLCSDASFAGVRIDQLALQCANGETGSQYLMLRATTSGQTFNSRAALQAADHTGHVVFDVGNLYPGKADGTPWPVGTAWLMAGASFDTSAGIPRDVGLAGLDPAGGTLVFYDRRLGGGILQTLAYGPAGTVPSPARGQSLRRVTDAAWSVSPLQQPENAAGASATITRCPCPPTGVALTGDAYVYSNRAVRDTSYGDTHARYDLTRGTAFVSTFGYSGLASVRAADVYTLVGGPTGQDVSLAATMHVTGQAHGGCDYAGNCSGGVGGARLTWAGTTIGQNFGTTSNLTLGLPLQVRFGEPWHLDWELGAQVEGYPIEASAGYDGVIGFTGVPPGASIVSCAGYRFDAPTATLPAILVAQPSLEVVHLEWSNSPEVVAAATVERMADGAPWQTLGTATAAPDGLVFDDRAITPGARYGYRLRWAQGGVDAFSEVTWVDVPAARLALRALSANPSMGAPVLEYTLPALGAARLDLLDLRGRRVWARDLGVQAPGSHAFAFAGGGPLLAPGIYWARITQAGKQALLRLVVIGHGS